MELTKEYLRELVYKVNGAALMVHEKLGPGLEKAVYQQCMMYELTAQNIDYQANVPIPITYDGVTLSIDDLKCDLLVENSLVVEVKAIEELIPIHISEILTYMKFLELPMGLMINFNCEFMISDGQRTCVNDFYNNIN